MRGAEPDAEPEAEPEAEDRVFGEGGQLHDYMY